MARRKRASAEQPIGVGLTTKQMKRKNHSVKNTWLI